MSSHAPIPLHIRVNRLFALGHRFDAPEQSTTEVAADLSESLGCPVDPEVLDALRSASTAATTSVDSAVLEALATHFAAPATYLTGTKDIERVDKQLRLLIAARDAQANGVCFRGDAASNDAAMEQMISGLEKDADRARRARSGS
ncbi:hypothetical protein Br6_04876 [Rhodococcus sp. Br-6]|nr:hypothetical protein Br6_04876 [Rhodococcus sp. Br-6]